MWDQILYLFLVLHVLAGFVAAFLAFPVAALATKGDKLHRLSGRVFVGCFFFICIGGYLLEFENFKGTVIPMFGIELNASPFAQGADIDVLAVINTAMVNTLAFYLAVSGWRVWARARAAEKGVFPIFDSVIAILEIGAGLLFATTLWIAIDQTAEINNLSSEFIALGHWIIIAATGYVMLDAGHDLYIGIARKPPKSWWIMHARKMITAEMGLAAAFPYRCAPLDGVGGMLMLVSMLVVLVIGLIIAKRFSNRIKTEAAIA